MALMSFARPVHAVCIRYGPASGLTTSSLAVSTATTSGDTRVASGRIGSPVSRSRGGSRRQSNVIRAVPARD